MIDSATPSTLAGVSWSWFLAGTLQAQPLKLSRVCSIAEYLSKIFMKAFEAKERARRYLSECFLNWSTVPDSSAAAGLGSEDRRGGSQRRGLL